ncbi:ladderlectin-like isoform X2 [Anarhichas minor]|uniref:ladderlectin-like isoform X2 n=1 Tax=Anarhichas minor TaxID=65739 RepID=UPI003F739BBB
MKTLTVSALVCAMIALTGAAVLSEGMPENDQSESHRVKWEAYCSYGWTERGHRCYRYIPTPMTWAEAEKNCVSLGGNLASVHSILEYHWIQRIIASVSHQYKSTWIGGSDAQEENKWFWSDGTSFSYKYWCKGQPSNYNYRQHCLQMNYGAEKCWDDVECSAGRPSVCVKRV